MLYSCTTTSVLIQSLHRQVRKPFYHRSHRLVQHDTFSVIYSASNLHTVWSVNDAGFLLHDAMASFKIHSVDRQ